MRTSPRISTISSVAILLASAMQASAAEELPSAKETIGVRVANFEAVTTSNQPTSFKDLEERDFHVLIFLGTECPLAKLYMPELNDLHATFAPKGIGFLGINSNSQDSLSEVALHAKKHDAAFPIWKDLNNTVADQFAARRTPEVVVIDAKGTIRYRGRIDDQYDVGVIRERISRQDLKIALEELLAGKAVSVPVTEPVGCLIGRLVEANPESKVTYSNQISRIMQQRCVECHREGQIAPFTLTEYDEVAGWAETIAETIEDNRMPPWHASPKHGDFLNSRRMTKEEKNLIYEWVENGAPEGDPADLPKPIEYVSGWTLAKSPDLVIPMRDEPYTVPAEGTVRYQYFRVDPGFTEDKWIKGAQIIPGNAQVVHHVLVLVRDKQGRIGSSFRDGFLAAYVPGLRTTSLPEGMAKRIPAGAELIFQVHYTPIGTEQQDLSKLGFVFADPDEVDHLVVTSQAATRRLEIPPNVGNHRVEAWSRKADSEVLLLGMSPHMHLRGKSFSYEVIYPDGTTKTMLDVPEYDFNWQTSYRLKEPLKLPKGSRMHCVAHFDNSEDNPWNPNPKATVKWGDQTWEEMMIGYFDIAIPLDKAKQQMKQADKEDQATQLAKQFIGELDANGDDVISRDEVPKKRLFLFNQVDTNKDQKVTVEELAAGIRAYRKASGQ